MEEKEHITIAICDDETVYGESVRNECIKFFHLCGLVNSQFLPKV